MTISLKPPFTLESAMAKVQRGEDLWNSKDPTEVAQAYTPESIWRNRVDFVKGRAEITQLLAAKWQRELNYKLKKELFTFSGNRIAVNFIYEYHDDNGQWFQAHGNEHWQFDDDGLMHTRDASINEMPITEEQRTLF